MPSLDAENDVTATSQRRALNQADAVLESVGGDYYLDGFNLLGVIANPLGVGSPSVLSTSFHGRYTTPSASISPSPSIDFYSDTYQSIESTLSHVSEQVEQFNHVLEDWSRQILEYSTEDHVHHEDIPDAQLRELPKDMQNLDFKSVQSYLERSGEVAAAFATVLQRHKEQQKQLQAVLGGSATTLPSLQETSEEDDGSSRYIATDDVPAVFFRPEMDLTNAETFRELLLDGNAKDEILADDDRPVAEWFPLLPADAFSGCLDKIELALMQQVRARSSEFFRESLRFAELQESMDSVLEQVVTLQTTCSSIQRNMLNPMKTVPTSDQTREDVRRILVTVESSIEVLECQAAIAGVLSAQDDLTAMEQITYGRRLLSQSHDGSQQLGELNSLRMVSQQMNQYESLVVTNLREELVEVFINWSADQSSSQIDNSSRLRNILTALKNCNGLSQARDVYKNRLHEIVSLTTQTTVSEFANDATKENTTQSTSQSAAKMSLPKFIDCLSLLFDQFYALLTVASLVNDYCVHNGVYFADSDANDATSTPVGDVIVSTAELATKAVAELLKSRKESHSLLSLNDMKSVWDRCQIFATSIEEKHADVSLLRSVLVTQAKAFVERRHESNMSSLVASLNSEKFLQCDVSPERQNTVTRLCSGLSLISNSLVSISIGTTEKAAEVEVEGTRFKAVWSCLLLIEMVISDVASAHLFPSLSASIVGKVSELLRLFNKRTTELVLGAGAIHSNAKLKSINARHLALVSQCLGMITALLPHVKSSLMTQLPSKQHILLNDMDKIRKEFTDHKENVLNKFVSIIGSVVNALAKQIPGTDFDARASIAGDITCCTFFDGVATQMKKMHQVLRLLPPEHLRDVFSRIYPHVDKEIPLVLSKYHSNNEAKFLFPISDDGKRRLLSEVQLMCENLNSLDGVLPWEFSAVSILERELDFRLTPYEERISSSSSGDEMTAAIEGEVSATSTEATVAGDDDGQQPVESGSETAQFQPSPTEVTSL